MKKLARQTGEATLTKSGILECIKKLLTAKNILGPLLKFFFVFKKSGTVVGEIIDSHFCLFLVWIIQTFTVNFKSVLGLNTCDSSSRTVFEYKILIFGN